MLSGMLESALPSNSIDSSRLYPPYLEGAFHDLCHALKVFTASAWICAMVVSTTPADVMRSLQWKPSPT